MSGQVILVGAGPGDPGLLTLKGRQALEEAQVVVYDRLVSPAILELIPPAAERINVGKEASHHPVPQDQINRILLEQAQAGTRVVRLTPSSSAGAGRSWSCWPSTIFPSRWCPASPQPWRCPPTAGFP